MKFAHLKGAFERHLATFAHPHLICAPWCTQDLGEKCYTLQYGLYLTMFVMNFFETPVNWWA